MELISKLFFIILFFDIIVAHIHCELTSVIYIDKGPVQGEIRTTVRNNMKFSAFRGIPYGKAPTGRSRFMPPQQAESWHEILNATSEAVPCPQMDPMHKNNYIGNENCLNINVYTPIRNFNKNNNTRLAVMIWLHGGQYKNGYTNITYFGPDYLIENNIVVVTINFRMGALGFLALNHTNATGNAALKDQRLGFKWVKHNIQYFGGDPDSVTIFGESTGGTSVDFHVLSSRSRGLFHRSISMSASPLCAWASATNHEMQVQAFNLGRLLGIHTTDTEKLLTAMYDIPAEHIIRATSKISTNLRPFKPTIEDVSVAGDSAFLTECSIRQYKSGNFINLPHMTGFMASEVLSFFTDIPVLEDAVKRMHEQSALIMADFTDNVTFALSNITGGLPQTVIAIAINKLIKESITNLTNILYGSPIDSKQQFLQKKTNSVYYYKISIVPKTAIHKIRGLQLNGAAHGDDIAYLWYMPLFNFPTDPNDPFVITRNRITRMWTNFAKYSNPTPLGNNDPLININWPTSGNHGRYLEINDVLSVKKQPSDYITKQIQATYLSELEKLSDCK